MKYTLMNRRSSYHPSSSANQSRFRRINDIQLSPNRPGKQTYHRQIEPDPAEITLPWQNKEQITTGTGHLLLRDYTQIHPLKDTWTLWYHRSDGDDWTINGYEELVDLKSLEEFWLVYQRIQDFTIGMFFLMRKGYLPIWEDYQKPVHFLKYITVKTNYMNEWLNLCLTAIGETACQEQDKMFGVSISPKVRNLIIRLWTFQTSMPVMNPILKLPTEKCQYT